MRFSDYREFMHSSNPMLHGRELESSRTLFVKSVSVRWFLPFQDYRYVRSSMVVQLPFDHKNDLLH